jgi:hypothetical protein
MPARTIDPETLARLASDPKLKPTDIAAGCGFGRQYFFMALGQNQRLWSIYEAARAEAGVPVFKLPALRRQKHGALDEVELIIIEAIGSGRRTMDAIRTVVINAGANPQTFAARLYNLENEKQEIWSAPVGHPPRTHYFLRSEEQLAVSSKVSTTRG